MPTFTVRSRRTARLAASALFLFLLCAACTFTDGERATTGECPGDEVCSDATPTGLTFYGALPGEAVGSFEFLRNIAMGGSQVLSFQTSDGTTLGEVDVDSTEPWFVEATAVTETDFGRAGAELRGLAEGSSYIRVLAPGTDELYDRVLIHVERIATVDAFSAASTGVTSGEASSVVFRLLADDGGRLVDEGMEITSTDVEIDRVSWDRIDFVAPTDSDEVAFVLDAGHRRWEVSVPVAR